MSSQDAGPSLYDTDDYYRDDRGASRLSPLLNGPLLALDVWRARSIQRVTRLKGGHVLDVGAGDGKFLHFMKNRGFSVYGTTASRRSQRSAKDRFGLDLELTTNLSSQVRAQSYDLITYWHVYEHLESPGEHTAHWRDITRERGFIAIEVPNIDSLGARLCYRSWLGSDDRHHCNHRLPAVIRDELVSHGFTVIQEQHVSLKFTYVFLWSALLGFLWHAYNFDVIMVILKEPLRMLRSRPWLTANALASVFYLFPVVATLGVLGAVAKRGEVFRIYGQRKGT